MKIPGQSGFTLVELIIVVSVVALLTAIAVPNFLRAQTRAQLAHAQKDLDSLHHTLTIRSMDNPKANNRHADPLLSYLGTATGDCGSYMVLTTPITYIPNMRDVQDIFYKDPENLGFPPFYPLGECYSFYSSKSGVQAWAAVGRGPDAFYETQLVFPLIEKGLSINRPWLYDPSNGLLSRGDLIRETGATYLDR